MKCRALLALVLALLPSAANAQSWFRNVVLPAAQAGGPHVCTPFVTDNFAGTAASNLSAHSPTSGATTWAYGDGTTVLLNGAGGIYTTQAAESTVNVNASPSSANYTVQAAFNVKSAVTGERVGVSLRLPSSGSSSGISGYYNRGAGGYNIADVSGGSGFTAGSAPNDGDVLKMTVVGNQATLYVNGLVVAGPVTVATATTGRPGVYFNPANAQSPTTGIHLTTFSACQ